MLALIWVGGTMNQLFWLNEVSLFITSKHFHRLLSASFPQSAKKYKQDTRVHFLVDFTP